MSSFFRLLFTEKGLESHMIETLLLPVHLKPLEEGIMIPFLLHLEVSHSLLTFSDCLLFKCSALFSSSPTDVKASS